MIEKDTSRVSMWKTTRMDVLVDAFRHQLINILDDFNAWKMSKEEFITKQNSICAWGSTCMLPVFSILGVNYNKKSNLSILYITISMAVATALVGPLSFLGLIVVNSAKELFKTNKHKTLMITSSLIAITIILGGQVILELLSIKTPVTVVVNLIGGLYLIYILVKENIKWLK